MKRSKKPLTFTALALAVGTTFGLVGCVPPEAPEVDVYGPPIDIQESKPEETEPPLSLEGDVAIVE